jgi:predicted P-loop ATPase
MNVGTVIGQELAPGQFLTDVDLDWGGAPKELLKLLPTSRCAFGRPSKLISHVFYATPERLPSVTNVKYKDPIDKSIIYVELFGGHLQHYVMVPPSIHSPNEELRFVHGDDWDIPGLVSVEELQKAVRNYAIACCLYRHLGHRGLLHHARLSLAGFLMKEGLSAAETEAIGVTVSVACGNDSRDFKLAVETTAAHLEAGNKRIQGKTALIEALGDVGKAVVAQIKSFIHESEFDLDEKGKIISTSVGNIRLALDKLDTELSFNQFSQKIFIKNGRAAALLDDAAWIPLWIKIDERFRFRPSENLFLNVLRDTAWKNEFHPVREYLDKLVWDGKPRLDTWLIHYGRAKDTPFIRSVSAKILIAAVRRVRAPGCKFDEILVLESGQGKAKSSAIQALCPDYRWFSDDLPLGASAKEIIEATAGKWIIEASELHGNRGKEAEHLKAFLSRQVDGPVRMAYDRTSTEVARQFILIGTTNQAMGYLKDPTGGRRFWPVRVGEFKIEELVRDRDQLWAEAAYRERGDASKGIEPASIRLEREYWEEAAKAQESRTFIDPWEDAIEEFIGDSDVVPCGPLWSVLEFHRANARNNRDAMRIKDIMQRFGFKDNPRIYVRDEKGVVRQQRCWVKDPDNLPSIVEWSLPEYLKSPDGSGERGDM